MSGFTPKGFLSLPAVFETAGKHLYPDSWTGAETSAKVLGFDQRRFDGEVDTYMVGWIVHWQAPETAVGTEARNAKASGEESTARRHRRQRVSTGRDQEEEWQEAEKILAEAQFAITLQREGGPGWRRWKDGAFRSSLPLELSESDVEAIAAAEVEYRGDHRKLVDAHKRMTGTTAWLCQQLCGTPPAHEDAIPAIEVYSDGKIRSIDPRAWARPEAPDLIKAALEAGDQDLTAKAGGGLSGQLFVSDENLIAPCPDSQPEEQATAVTSGRRTAVETKEAKVHELFDERVRTGLEFDHGELTAIAREIAPKVGYELDTVRKLISPQHRDLKEKSQRK